jgi:hypothetical protein
MAIAQTVATILSSLSIVQENDREICQHNAFLNLYDSVSINPASPIKKYCCFDHTARPQFVASRKRPANRPIVALFYTLPLAQAASLLVAEVCMSSLDTGQVPHIGSCIYTTPQAESGCSRSTNGITVHWHRSMEPASPYVGLDMQ